MKKSRNPPVSNYPKRSGNQRLSKGERRLLQIVEREPTATSSRFAELTGSSVSGVTKTLSRLRQKGAVTERLEVAPDFSEFWFHAMISIKVNPGELTSRRHGYGDQQTFMNFLLKRLIAHPDLGEIGSQIQVSDCRVVLGGEGDLVMMVAATHPDCIRDLVTKMLRHLSGVQNTHTAMIF